MLKMGEIFGIEAENSRKRGNLWDRGSAGACSDCQRPAGRAARQRQPGMRRWNFTVLPSPRHGKTTRNSLGISKARKDSRGKDGEDKTVDFQLMEGNN